MGALPVVRMELELRRGPLHHYCVPFLLKMHHLKAAWTASWPLLSWASGSMGSAKSKRSWWHQLQLLYSTPANRKGPPCHGSSVVQLSPSRESNPGF